jgi:sucrose phosphorylase
VSKTVETQVNRFMVAQAIMLSLQGMPGIYFHSLFGSRGDRAGADASGIPRRINREKMTRADLENDLAESATLRARVFSRFERLLGVRKNEPAFSPIAAQQVLDLDSCVFALVRRPARGRAVLCVHNVTNDTLEVSVPDACSGKWRNLFDETKTYRIGRSRQGIRLAPYEVLWAGRDQAASLSSGG